MWIKGGFAAHREYVGALGVYAGEVRFFTDVAPKYDVHHPASFFAARAGRSRAGHRRPSRICVLVMWSSPSSPARFRSRRSPPGWRRSPPARPVMELRRRAAAGVGLVMGAGTDVDLAGLVRRTAKLFRARPGRYAAALSLHDPDRLRAAATAYRALVQQEPRCLLHADAHIGNAYVEQDGTVGFVDWQTTAVGQWAHDVNYFLVSALDFPDRRAYEAELLEHYLKALGEPRRRRTHLRRGAGAVPPVHRLRFPVLAVQPRHLAAGAGQCRDVRQVRSGHARPRHVRPAGCVTGDPAHAASTAA